MDIAEIIRAAVTYGAPALTAKRLFGPSVDVVANRLANSTEWMIDNVKAVLTNAAKKTTSLVALGLLSESSAYGPGESVMRTAKSAGSLPGDVLVMYPSENGMELFFAAHGFSQIMAPLVFGRPEYELDEIDLSVEEGISTDRLRKMTQLERDEWFIAHS